MPEIFMQTAFILSSIMFGMGLGAGLLLLCLRNSNGGDPKSYWALHSTLNALSKLASQTEAGRKIDIELIYLMGEHLKSVGILVERKGWVGTSQLDAWISSTVSLHRHVHNDRNSVTRLNIQLPTTISIIHAQKLTDAILWVLNGHEFVRHISLIVLEQSDQNWLQNAQLQVRLRVDLSSSSPGLPPKTKSKIDWRKDAEGSLLCDFRMACQHGSPDARRSF